MAEPSDPLQLRDLYRLGLERAGDSCRRRSSSGISHISRHVHSNTALHFY